MSEDRLAMAERFVRENERRTAKQAAIIARLESEGHFPTPKPSIPSPSPTTNTSSLDVNGNVRSFRSLCL
jgi:hypothetical protein